MKIFLVRNPALTAIMKRTPPDQPEILSARLRRGPAIGRPRQFAVGPDSIRNVGDHPATNGRAIARFDSRVTNRPIISPFNHSHSKPVSRLRVNPTLRQPPGHDAARRSAAQNNHIVVVVSIAGLNGSGSGRPGIV